MIVLFLLPLVVCLVIFLLTVSSKKEESLTGEVGIIITSGKAGFAICKNQKISFNSNKILNAGDRVLLVNKIDHDDKLYFVEPYV